MKGLKRLIPQRKKKNASSDSNDNITEALFLNEDDPSAHRRHNVTETNMEPAAPSPDSEPVSRYTTVDEDYDPSLAFLARGNDETTSFGEQAHELSSWPEDPISIPEQSFSTQLNGAKRKLSTGSTQSDATFANAFDSASLVIQSYADVPLLEQTKLPRGGVSMETKAVGRVQFGIPPETIKDSMRLGLSVPAVYIVPVERFCREMGPALGVNLAEFEFPAYFNFFIHKKVCTLVVDSEDAEQNIRRVFSETLLGPAQFRREVNPIAYEEEDFAPDFPRDAIPNFQKELEYFRIMPDGKELVLETLLNFRHFEMPGETGVHENLGVPPPLDYWNTGDHQQRPGSEYDDGKDTDELDMSFNLDSSEVDQSKEVSTMTKMQLGQKARWKYSQARWIGDVATVWPSDATQQQIAARTCKRVEIFKMPGGTEYILHDIDENNHIVGKARFSGHVKVSESMGVDGFGATSEVDDTGDEDGDDQDTDDADSDTSELPDILFERRTLPPTFNPPSFGVTILGNSHGFDKSGSVSGYVLWINGRGVMIDPPPYSSATLEREGIRPRTIVGIILTHCHADHDAGAFQKVLTGSPVVVITTPTIYKSFIRKYAALSALSPALLRHSHRHKPAIIGSPLRFQGATFHFTYTLHTIPCVGFRVDWRGRSMVFTGDHFNFPPAIDKLQASGVLSKARADDLRNLPLQDTDLLLHEAGAPPIHTPLDVLLKLPQRVKRRMYVVHTSALPEGCELRVAPTGTAGTIRLDQVQKASGVEQRVHHRGGATSSMRESVGRGDDSFPASWGRATNEYEPISEEMIADLSSSDPRLMTSSFAHLALATTPTKNAQKAARSNSLLGTDLAPPLVSLRPASSTDAWFILNLLSAVPFLTSLSYASTMEVLETARVDAYCKDEIIVPAARRNQVLCVVWEGTCVERAKGTTRIGTGGRRIAPLLPVPEMDWQGINGAVWHAGDWTGPIALQPEKHLSGDSNFGTSHDVVAMSSEGVKAISVEFSNLHAILKSGSALYRKYLERRNLQRRATASRPSNLKPDSTAGLLDDAMRNLNALELLDCNSAMRKLSAVQKRHLESLAEGPVYFQPGERLWRAGAPVDKAFVVVSGTASFVPRRRNAGSVGLPPSSMGSTTSPSNDFPSKSRDSDDTSKLSLGETMQRDALAAVRELRIPDSEVQDCATEDAGNEASARHFQLDSIFTRPGAAGQESVPSSLTDAHDYAKLSRGLQKRADILNRAKAGKCSTDKHEELSDGVEDDDSAQNLENVFLDLETEDVGRHSDTRDHLMSRARRRSSRARFANKVLGRLYSRRAFTGGLVFSRGHFLGDVSKMVAPLLSMDADSDLFPNKEVDDGPNYGFGEKMEGTRDASLRNLQTVQEQNDSEFAIVHSSTLTAGKDGCVVLVFLKPSLIPFLDEYPGLLLSLLGTQVVV